MPVKKVRRKCYSDLLFQITAFYNIDSGMAHQIQLSCNNLTCRTSLSFGSVWVTLCGHIFCDSCGTDCYTNKVCVSCRDTLGQYSIARKKSLNFGEEWKKLILAGLPPDTVMEVCTSAIQFYQNQTGNEVNLMEEKIRRNLISQMYRIIRNYFLK